MYLLRRLAHIEQMKIGIQLTPEAQETLRIMQTLPPEALAGMVKVMDYENLFTIGHIQQAYLQFPSDGPTTPIGLRHITGRLYGSIRASRSVIEEQSVSSAIGSNVEYAAIHEFGGEIPPHTITAK